MFASIADLLERNTVLLDEWACVDWQASDPGAVSIGAARLLRDAERLKAVALLALGEHERRGGVARDGDASAGDFAARQAKSSPQEGRRSAARAKRLATATRTARAAAEGRLSTEQADKLASARNDQNAEAFDAREDELIEKAERSLEDAIKAADDFRTETGETAQARADRLWKRRSAACWDDEDGMTQGRQSLAGDDAAVFKLTFDAYVAREFDRREKGDARTYAQIRADASAAMARGALHWLEGDRPGLAGRAQVQVLVRYEDLVADNIAEWAAEILQTGQPLTGDAVRRLCCDADVVRIVTKGESLTLDVGRRTRTVPTPLRRAVLARDQHRCAHPGCHARDGIQVHHIRHWTRLGTTDLDNLLTLCWRHHRLVHEGGWEIHVDGEAGRPVWTAPDGRRLIGERRATAGAPRRRSAAA